MADQYMAIFMVPIAVKVVAHDPDHAISLGFSEIEEQITSSRQYTKPYNPKVIACQKIKGK